MTRTVSHFIPSNSQYWLKNFRYLKQTGWPIVGNEGRFIPIISIFKAACLHSLLFWARYLKWRLLFFINHEIRIPIFEINQYFNRFGEAFWLFLMAFTSSLRYQLHLHHHQMLRMTSWIWWTVLEVHRPFLENPLGWLGWGTWKYCWWLKSSQPVEVGSLSHYVRGFIHPWWCRISAINSIPVEQEKNLPNE